MLPSKSIRAQAQCFHYSGNSCYIAYAFETMLAYSKLLCHKLKQPAMQTKPNTATTRIPNVYYSRCDDGYKNPYDIPSYIGFVCHGDYNVTYESYKVAEIPAPYVGIKRAPCALRLTMIDLICRTSFGVGWNCAYPIWLLQGDIVTLLGISQYTLPLTVITSNQCGIKKNK